MSENFYIPAMPTVFPPAERDYPISPGENLMRALRHEKPLWMPDMYGSSQFPPMGGYGDQPFDMFGDSEDWFGVQYHYTEEQGSATAVNHALSEIVNWREEIKWPDLDAWDFKQGYDGFVRDENLALGALFINGIFERLHLLEGFEQALVDLISEPEECLAFFERTADLKIEVFNRLNELYHFEYLVYNDDWNTQRGPFFSMELFEETLLAPTKRIFDAVKSAGVRIISHSCGLMQSYVPVIVETLGADGMEIQNLNDYEEILSKYGDKVTPSMLAEPTVLYDPKTTPERAKEFARSLVDAYGAHNNPGAGILLGGGAKDEEVYHAFMDEVYEYSLEKYKGL
jgi:uroporphyrinogen decarboxylase